VLSNNTIWQYWGKYFNKIFKDQKSYLHLIPDGERYKNIKTVSEIYEHLSLSGATRNTALIAVGGGVIGDLGGFVASTYHRGIPLVHVPTTLLAQVDSSIGGKTGYNLKTGKNIVGTFYQPAFIFVDTNFLNTLPDREFLSGMAEVIKSALIKDGVFFEYLEKNREKILKRDNRALMHVVKTAEKIKIGVVERDERESGERAILNFGHTIGHAIERYKNWKISHGEAVAIGMCYAAALSLKKGYITELAYNRINSLIKNFGLPTSFKIAFEKLEKLIYYDKKRREKDVEWVLLKDIGHAVWGEKL
jgi:3-dehydroquinate synthase